MNENVIQGGAAPALAAHSKDAATQGQTPASAMTGENGGSDHRSEPTGDKVEAGIDRVKASVRQAASSARDMVAGQNGAADHAADFIRAQPLIALSVTGAICFAFGVLLGRR